MSKRFNTAEREMLKFEMNEMMNYRVKCYSSKYGGEMAYLNMEVLKGILKYRSEEKASIVIQEINSDLLSLSFRIWPMKYWIFDLWHLSHCAVNLLWVEHPKRLELLEEKPKRMAMSVSP